MSLKTILILIPMLPLAAAGTLPGMLQQRLPHLLAIALGPAVATLVMAAVLLLPVTVPGKRKTLKMPKRFVNCWTFPSTLWI